MAARRRCQDQLLDAAVTALVARAEAVRAIQASRAALDAALEALAELGVGRDELAVMLGVPTRRLVGPIDVPGAAAGVGPVRAAAVDRCDDGGAVRLWLAMIDRGPSPRTHGLDGDGGLLCRGAADAALLTTWTGFAFDVDCRRCARLLADHLTPDEFG